MAENYQVYPVPLMKNSFVSYTDQLLHNLFNKFVKGVLL